MLNTATVLHCAPATACVCSAFAVVRLDGTAWIAPTISHAIRPTAPAVASAQLACAYALLVSLAPAVSFGAQVQRPREPLRDPYRRLTLAALLVPFAAPSMAHASSTRVARLDASVRLVGMVKRATSQPTAQMGAPDTVLVSLAAASAPPAPPGATAPRLFEAQVSSPLAPTIAAALGHAAQEVCASACRGSRGPTASEPTHARSTAHRTASVNLQ